MVSTLKPAKGTRNAHDSQFDQHPMQCSCSLKPKRQNFNMYVAVWRWQIYYLSTSKGGRRGHVMGYRSWSLEFRLCIWGCIAKTF